MKVALEKPGTPGELVHFGTKGMKWGVHRTQGTHQFKKDFPTAGARFNEIRRARLSVETTKNVYKSAPKGPERQKLKEVHLKNPDRATALRMTRGEKAVYTIFTLGVPVALPISLAVDAAVLSRVGRRRALEK